MSSTGIAYPVGVSGGLSSIPSYTDLSTYNVNRDGWEVVRQTLYDSNQYAAAGQTVLTFFANPIGQGVGWAGGVKTLSDTNMNAAGQMPNMQEFLVQSVEIAFEPTTPTVAAGMPATSAAALIVATQINDAYIFYRAGYLQLTIGSKAYLTEAPLMKFPPKAYYELHAGVANAAAGATTATIAYGTARGRPYLMNGANLRLVSNQNFNVTLNWPEGVQAITDPARVFVILDGLLYRRSQ